MDACSEVVTHELDALREQRPTSRSVNFREGHFAGVSEFESFPHICPGLECAIARWIQERAKDRR